MKITIGVSALEQPDGNFIPHFHISEHEGDHDADINYLPMEKGISSSKQEALRYARVQALREVKEKYGNNVEIIFNEE